MQAAEFLNWGGVELARRELHLALRVADADASAVGMELGRFANDMLGILEREAGHPAAAPGHFIRCLDIMQRLIDTHGESPERLGYLSDLHKQIGRLERDAGHAGEARWHVEQSLAIVQRLIDEHGESPERLRNLSLILERLGDLDHDDGDSAAERAHLERNLEITQRLIDTHSKSPELLRNLSISLLRLGDIPIDSDAGDTAVSRRRFERRLEIDQDMIDIYGESPEQLDNLSLSHQRLGDLLTDDDSAAARGHFERSLKFSQRLIDTYGESPEQLLAHVQDLLRLGSLDLQIDDGPAAREHFEQSLVLGQRLIDTYGESPERLRSLSMSRQLLGELDQYDGHSVAARGHFERSLKFMQRLIDTYGESPERLNDLSIILFKLGNLDREDGHSAAAREHLEHSLEIGQRLIDTQGESPERLRHISILHSGLGDFYWQGDQRAAAREHFERSWEIDRRAIVKHGESPERLRNFSVSEIKLGDLDFHDGHTGAALCHFIGAADRAAGLPTTRGTWPADALACTERLLSVAEHIALDQLYSLRSRLWRGLLAFWESCDPTSRLACAGQIARFHALWLRHALSRAPDRIPEILGGMQGRKIAALLLAEFADPGAQASPEARRFAELRLELARLALALKALEPEQAVGLSRPGGSFEDYAANDDRMGRRAAVPEHLSQQREQQQAEQRARRLAETFDRYRQVQREVELARQGLVNQGGPALAVLLPQPPELHAQALQQGLAEDEALLLLLHTPPGDSTSGGLAADGASGCDTHALVLTRSGIGPVLPLPALSRQLPSLLAHAGRPLDPRGEAFAGVTEGLRDCGGLAGVAATATATATATAAAAATSGPAPDVERLLQECLWQPLQALLPPSLLRLHLVSHGALHVLPLALGSDRPVLLYPGLIFFWQCRQGAWARASGLALHVHSPKKDPQDPRFEPIPFVHAEAELVSRVWGRPDELLDDGAAGPSAVQAVHLACHGWVDGNASAPGSGDAFLVTASGPLDMQRVLRLQRRTPVVFLSACLVGRQREDVDGDPLGLVSAFFVKGARGVVAALAPISDFWAPVLAVLFHDALRHPQVPGAGDNASADANPDAAAPEVPAWLALQCAKQALHSGHWSPAVQQHVREVLTAHLALWIGNQVLAPQARPNELSRLLARVLDGPSLHPPGLPARSEVERAMLPLLQQPGKAPPGQPPTSAWAAETAAAQAASALIEPLIAARHHLHLLHPVRNLLINVTAFGQG
ncbi:MAG: CHAT domain-containing protein [Novosphingobium sp.]|nr:CHAT domain-containing protein [Novosphingobium sp.]